MHPAIWLVFWFVSLGLLLWAPVLCVEKRRKLWFLRFRLRRWNVQPEGEDSSAPFQYVLTKDQEDSIRESFLTAKLKPYTKSLTNDMVVVDDRVDASVSSNQNKTEKSSAEVEDGMADIEKGEAETGIKEETEVDPTVIVIDGSDAVTSDSAKADSDVVFDIDEGISGPTEQEKECKRECEASSEEEKPLEYVFDQVQGKIHGLPLAGEPHVDDTNDKKCRQVANCCAICLSAFEQDEKICWSSNPACQHVFHSDCILDWLQASGRKYLRNMRKNYSRDEHLPFWKLNPIERITTFPMSCPCCRQVFVIPTDDDDTSDAGVVKERNNTGAPEGDQGDTANNDDNISHAANTVPVGAV